MEELKFEKLSDVEVVEEPSEESHVLIVEGGEVKKAPKTAVGGAGGGVFDVNITLSRNSDTQWYTNPESFDKTFEEIKDAMDKGCYIRCFVKQYQFDGDADYHYTNGYIRPAFAIYVPLDGDERIHFIPEGLSGCAYYIKPDNSMGCLSD